MPLFPSGKAPTHTEAIILPAALKAQITALSAANTSFKTMLGMPPPMVMAGMPPMPVSLQPALAPYLGAMKTHADNYDKLLKLLADVIDKS